MSGILIYTAAPDSEGTLGGLVSMGETETLERHLEAALEILAICALDPLCAENQPDHAFLSLHGAACHNGLFLPEMCCEVAIDIWIDLYWSRLWNPLSSRSSIPVQQYLPETDIESERTFLFRTRIWGEIKLRNRMVERNYLRRSFVKS